MATCSQITSILKSCDSNIGGIKALYLWDMEDQYLTSPEFSQDANTWTITALDITQNGANTPVVYQFIRNSSNYTEEYTIDLVNGSTFVTTTVTANFSRREAGKSKSIKLLTEGQRYLGALVLDSNGIYWLFQDLQLSASTEGSGTAKADGSKYTVTLLSETAEFAKVVSNADANTLISSGLFT